jgi:hypothetical protein
VHTVPLFCGAFYRSWQNQHLSNVLGGTFHFGMERANGGGIPYSTLVVGV